MAEKLKTITHLEISAATASKLGKEHTTDSVAKVVETYRDTTFEMAEQYAPTTKDERVLIQTPLVGFSITHDGKEVSIKNEDGTVHKTSGGTTRVSLAVTRTLVETLNKGIKNIINGGSKSEKEKKVA